MDKQAEGAWIYFDLAQYRLSAHPLGTFERRDACKKHEPDAHSVIDAESGKRINPAADIILENHVWLGNSTFINKGCTIGHDSIIAGRSVVTHSVDPNTIAAGVPAKVVKTGVIWDRKRIDV